MWTLVLWRPLVFWDIEQIEEIKKQEIKDKLEKDDDFIEKKKRYNILEKQIYQLQDEQNWIDFELKQIAKKYWVSEKQLYKFI